MLYVGVLKSKYDVVVRNTTISYLLVILFTTVLALILVGLPHQPLHQAA